MFESNKAEFKNTLGVIFLDEHSREADALAFKLTFPLAGKPVLQHVVDRLIHLGCRQLVLVSSTNPSLFEELHIPPDVSLKLCIAASQLTLIQDLQTLVRKTHQYTIGKIIFLYGDCPLLRAEICKTMLERLTNPISTVFLVTKRFFGTKKTRTKRSDPFLREVRGFACLSDRFLKEIPASQLSGDMHHDGLLAVASSLHVEKEASYVSIDPLDGTRVRNLQNLAAVERIVQERLRVRHINHGVFMVAPDTCYFSMCTQLSRGVAIEPYVYFGRDVEVHEGCKIKAFSYLEGVVVGAYSEIGPFARLRPDSILGQHTRIGNFVEVKQSVIGDHTKANHLAYLGDAQVGKHTNIGAGTITCNYDGERKHPTTIGDHVFVGSNSALIAPVSLSEGVCVAAGTVVTEDILENTLAIGRPQLIKKTIKRKKPS